MTISLQGALRRLKSWEESPDCLIAAWVANDARVSEGMNYRETRQYMVDFECESQYIDIFFVHSAWAVFRTLSEELPICVWSRFSQAMDRELEI